MVEDVMVNKPNEIIRPSIQDELDEIDKERVLKEWRKSLSYYSLNPEDFKFRFSSL